MKKEPKLKDLKRILNKMTKVFADAMYAEELARINTLTPPGPSRRLKSKRGKKAQKDFERDKAARKARKKNRRK